MKLEFRFLSILTGDWIYDPPVEEDRIKTCVVFPCFSCKLYGRGNLLEQNEFIININSARQRFTDFCQYTSNVSVTEGFNKIEYDLKGSAYCSNYSRDLAITRKL